jgi:hypothetical protein
VSYCSPLRHAFIRLTVINHPGIHPILHTAWLNNRALTLKRNTAKYYFGEKSSFLHTFLKRNAMRGFKKQ